MYLGGFKKTRIILIETALSFLGGFFFSVMIPLNFIHPDYLPSSTSLFLIKDAKGMFNIREVWFYFCGNTVMSLGPNLHDVGS